MHRRPERGHRLVVRNGHHRPRTVVTAAGPQTFPSDGTIPSDYSMWQPRLGITEAIVPPEFPLAIADRLVGDNWFLAGDVCGFGSANRPL